MLEIDAVFCTVVLGSFVAAVCNAAFSAGGAQIILAVTSLLLPVTAIVPVHSTLLIGSNMTRLLLFRQFVDWRFVGPFLLGSVVGAMLGARIYIELPASTTRRTVFSSPVALW